MDLRLDVANLLDPNYAKLAPYTQSAGIYKCPADRSYVISGGRRFPRVRSLSLSQAMNSRDDWLSYLTHKKYTVFRKLTDLSLMGASQAYVFIDEHPDSLNYGDFAVTMNDGAWLHASACAAHLHSTRWLSPCQCIWICRRILNLPRYSASSHLPRQPCRC